MANEKRLIDANELLADARRCRPILACLADIVDIEHLVKDQPTVDAVEVVHGQWEQGDYYDCGDVCSVCDWDCAIDDCHWSYCPNCGAKMDLKGDNYEG